MSEKHIPSIIEIIEKIVSLEDRKRKYTDRQITKTLIVLQTFNILQLSQNMLHYIH